MIRSDASDFERGRRSSGKAGSMICGLPSQPGGGGGTWGNLCIGRSTGAIAEPRPRLVEPNEAFDLETYVKDLHWLAEKIMLVTEKSMFMMSEVQSDQLLAHVRTATTAALPPVPPMDHNRHGSSHSSTGDSAGVDEQSLNRIDETIRSSVSNAVLLMEARVIQSIQANGRSDSMEEEICKALADNARYCTHEIQEHSQRTHQQGKFHEEALDAQGETLDEMLKKMDKLIELANLQSANRGPTTSATPAKGDITGPTGTPGSERDEWIKAGERAADDDPGLDIGEIVKEPKEPKEQLKKHVDSPKRDHSMSSVTSFSNHSLHHESHSFIERVTASAAFEIVFGLLIVLNTVKMCVEAEYRGWGLGYDLRIDGMLATSQANSDIVDMIFYVIELMFGSVFTVEVIAKMAALRCRFWRSGWNVFDTVIISISWFCMFANLSLPVSPMLLRLFRLVRLLRLLRSLSSYEIFDDLQLMVKALKAGAPVLIWVFILVGPALACVSLGMTYSLVDFIADEGNKREDRVECFNLFGTFTRSFLSMFEVTFGNWAPICRFLYTRVDERFALFFMCYQLGMGVAVLRIVYGVFLHVTFRCAAADENLMIAQKSREEKKFAHQIRDLFNRFDTSHSGSLSKEEFHTIAEDHRCRTLLSAMQLDVQDADTVFDLSCVPGHDEICADDMVVGFGRLKGYARHTALADLLHREAKSVEKLDKLVSISVQIASKIGAHVHMPDGFHAH